MSASKHAGGISPFAPARLAVLPPLDGVRLAACEAGIRYAGRKDLMLAVVDAGTAVAGVLTRSRTASAPVDWCRARLEGGVPARALVVNSGNANAFTGMRGTEAARATAEAAGLAVRCAADEVFLASTGVIGEPLDPARFVHHLAALAETLDASAWEDAARAIMTTDTFPKLATASVEAGGVAITINGIAKGSGMIAPDMGTMLAFVFTDAGVAPAALQAMTTRACDTTFNAITVDGDTSTSDTLLAFATGTAAARGASVIEDEDSAEARAFFAALEDVMRDLAQQIVKDGEGASKFVTVIVEGAESDTAAKRVALSIANSPLVKTAIAGEDANWGRVVMAVGKAGEAADRDRLAIWFGDIRVAVNGERDPAYDEAAAAAYMQHPELTLRVDLGVGQGRAQVWTCDFTSRYIAINADYRS